MRLARLRRLRRPGYGGGSSRRLRTCVCIAFQAKRSRVAAVAIFFLCSPAVCIFVLSACATPRARACLLLVVARFAVKPLFVRCGSSAVSLRTAAWRGFFHHLCGARGGFSLQFRAARRREKYTWGFCATTDATVYGRWNIDFMPSRRRCSRMREVGRRRLSPDARHVCADCVCLCGGC